MDCCLLGASVHGILQARILEWVAISYFQGDICLDSVLKSKGITLQTKVPNVKAIVFPVAGRDVSRSINRVDQRNGAFGLW